MNKHLISLLAAARIPKETYELALKDDADEAEVSAKLQDYNDTQVAYWKDKHPEFTPDKIKELEKKYRDEGTMKSARLLAEAMGIPKKDVEGKSFDEVTEILKSAKGKPDATADEWKTKATTLEAELAKINSEVIPGIHNEYKAKEMNETRDKNLFKLFDTVPVLDEFKTDFADIVRKRIATTGIEVKLGGDGKSLEYYDKDGTRAKNKATGKDLTDTDFVDVIKPTLKGYIKESNGDPNPPKPAPVGGKENPVNAGREARLNRNKQMREAVIK
jgi:uncharacterized protein YhfF